MTESARTYSLRPLDLDAQPGVFVEQRHHEAPMVVRSLRLSVDIETRARKVAAERGVPVTTVMREWIEQGLTAAETATREDDPVAELGKRLAEANRVYQVIVNRRAAA